MKITSHSLLSFSSVAVGAVFAVFLISSMPAAATYPSASSSPAHKTSAVDSADQQAVMAPINQMFDGMSKRDAAMIKKPTLTGGSMVLMRDGKPTQMTFEDFATRVGKPGTTKIEERIHDPLVRIDNDLAVVWAPFEFLVDGKVDHCGTDLFNLVRVDGQWIIASVADTGRKNCVRN
jgi:Putative lumazine-binding